MSEKRIVYWDWLMKLDESPPSDRSGSRPLRPPGEGSLEERTVQRERQKRVRREVDKALENLSEDEQEFVRLFYWEGKSYRHLSERSGRAVHKLEALHRRAIRKLKKQLKPFVESFYRLELEPDDERRCVICESEELEELNDIIMNRDKTQSWRNVIRLIRQRYGLRINTPQLLIGHEKYHICDGNNTKSLSSGKEKSMNVLNKESK